MQPGRPILKSTAFNLRQTVYVWPMTQAWGGKNVLRLHGPFARHKGLHRRQTLHLFCSVETNLLLPQRPLRYAHWRHSSSLPTADWLRTLHVAVQAELAPTLQMQGLAGRTAVAFIPPLLPHCAASMGAPSSLLTFVPFFCSHSASDAMFYYAGYLQYHSPVRLAKTQEPP